MDRLNVFRSLKAVVACVQIHRQCKFFQPGTIPERVFSERRYRIRDRHRVEIAAVCKCRARNGRDIPLHVDGVDVSRVLLRPRVTGHCTAAADGELAVVVEYVAQVIAAAALLQYGAAGPMGIERCPGGRADVLFRHLRAAVGRSVPTLERIAVAGGRRQPAVGRAGVIGAAVFLAVATVGVKIDHRGTPRRILNRRLPGLRDVPVTLDHLEFRALGGDIR